VNEIIKVAIVTALLIALVFCGVVAVSTWATALTESAAQRQAAVIATEGQRAQAVAAAAVTHAAAAAVRADTRAAHPDQFDTRAPVLPWVLLAVGLGAMLAYLARQQHRQNEVLAQLAEAIAAAEGVESERLRNLAGV
jgi:cytochrome bd-type quinol oxidase subunit 2